MNKTAIRGRSLVTWLTFTREEIRLLIDSAMKIRNSSVKSGTRQRFKGKTLALAFLGDSFLTRTAIETSFGEEGGHCVFFDSADLCAGQDLAIEDTARALGRMFDGIACRGFAHQETELLAKYAGVPVINALSDTHHPVQALADMVTLQREYGPVEGRKIMLVGEIGLPAGRSIMAIASRLGVRVSAAAPRAAWPDDEFLGICASSARESGGVFEIGESVDDAARGADAVYICEKVAKAFPERQSPVFSADLLDRTGNPRSVFLDSMPARRGSEVEFALYESTRSRVFEQVENRKHAMKAILLALL